MATDTKRIRDSTHSLSNLLDEDNPADKSVKLENVKARSQMIILSATAWFHVGGTVAVLMLSKMK